MAFGTSTTIATLELLLQYLRTIHADLAYLDQRGGVIEEAVATEYSDDEMPVYRRWKPPSRGAAG